MRRLSVIFTVLVALLYPSIARANESAQGNCEQGNRSVILGGLTSTTKVQQSFPQCIIAVYLHGTVSLATIYSDNSVPPTPIPSSSFTATATGHWQFYAPNGNYDVIMSGAGFPSPFTLSDIVIGGVTLDCSVFSGATAGAKLFACNSYLQVLGGGVADATNITGAQTCSQDINSGVSVPVTIRFGYITLACTVGWSIPSNNRIIGIFGGSTLVLNGAANSFMLNVGATTVSSNVELGGLTITVNSGSGGISVGSVSQNFNNSLFRLAWSIHDINMNGPSCSVACTLPTGTVGITATQYIDWVISNVTILGFERPWLLDRGGNSGYTRLRGQAFRYGPKWTNKGGSGTISPGSALDTCTACEFLGPTTTGGGAGVGYGYTAEFDAPFVRIVGGLYEPQGAGFNSQGAIHITNHGGGFQDIGGNISWDLTGGTLDNTMVFDTGYDYPQFIGTSITVSGFPSISFGTPTHKAQFIGVSPELTSLVVAQPLGKAVVTSLATSNDYETATEINNQEGMLRIKDKSGYSQLSPTTGKGLEISYQDGGDQAILTAIDRTTSGFKPLLAQVSGLTVNINAASPTIISNISGNQFGIGVQPTSSAPGMQHKRVSTGSVGASSQTTVNVNWTVPFIDANYTSACWMVEGTANNTLQVLKADGLNGSTTTVRVINNDGGGAHTGTINCIAMHD